MEELPWTWKINKSYDNGIVDATIHSCDNKTQFTVNGLPGSIVDGVVALLTSSYKWGASEASNVAALSDTHQEFLQPSSDEIAEATASIVEEIERLKDENKRANQAIGGLKGTITRLKNKYGESDIVE
jgi:hypothetical protein